MTTFILPGPLAEDKGKVLLVLNWISFCLVSEATEQSIAAALAKSSSGGLDIVLATNVSITPTQQEYADRFFTAINALMRGSHSTEHGQRDLLALIARYAWKRVYRKASLVINCGNPFSKSKETTMEIITRLVNLKPGGKDLLVAFNGIISLTPSLLSDDPEERLATLIALTIISSPLLLALGTGGAKDNMFARHFYRRIHRLRFYQYGIEALLDPKRKMLNPKWQFRPRWLPHVPSLTLHLPRSSTDHVSVMLELFGYKPAREEIIKLFFPWFDGGELWNAGDTQTLYVHPEARMQDYLMNNPVTLVSRTIGCSKRACRACSECVLRSDEISEEEIFSITARTDKIQINWMCPNIEDTSFTAGMGRLNDKVRLEEIKATYERTLGLWGGED